MIKELHCCRDCASQISVPVDPNFKKWQCECLKKNKNINHDGGITDCNEWSKRV